jgi:hypothetical protein
MLDKRKITAATAVIGALALPATATAQDATDGYRGLGANAGDGRASHPRPDAVDGYRGIGTKAVDNGAHDSQPGRPADTRVTPVVRVIDASGDRFDWNDAGIGAAGGLAIIAIAGGIAVATTGRRRSARRVASVS